MSPPVTDDGTALKTAWLQPLSRVFGGRTTTIRLTSATLRARDGARFIEALMPSNKKTNRYASAVRVRVESPDGCFTGTVERRENRPGERVLWIRVVS